MATKQQEGMNFERLLEEVGAEVVALDDLYSRSVNPASDEAKAVREALRAKLEHQDEKVRKQRWGAFIGWLMEPVVIPAEDGSYFESRILALALGPDSDHVQLADAIREAQKATGTVIHKFNRVEVTVLRDALRKQGVQTTVGGLLGRMQAQVQTGGVEARLSRWLSEKDRAKRGRQRKQTEDAVRRGLGGGRVETKVETKPDPEAERKAAIAAVESMIADAEASRVEALKAEDGDALKASKADIVRLREELAKLTAPAAESKVAKPTKPAKKQGKVAKPAATVTPAPTPEPAPVASGDGNGQPDDPAQALIALCQSAPEGSPAKIILGRFVADEINADTFMAKGRTLGLVK